MSYPLQTPSWDVHLLVAGLAAMGSPLASHIGCLLVIG
jgi:hypothetical protein